MNAVERRRLRPAERRVQILAEARSIFERLPYKQVSMDDIAAAAGVTRVIVYRHFESKHALYSAVVERNVADLREKLIEAFSVSPDPREALMRGLSTFLDFIEQRPITFRMLTWEAATILDERERAEILHEWESVAQRISRVIRDLLIESGRDSSGAELYAVVLMAGAGNWWIQTASRDRALILKYVLELLTGKSEQLPNLDLLSKSSNSTLGESNPGLPTSTADGHR